MDPEKKTDPSVKDFAASFKGFLDQISSQPALADEPVFLRRIRRHFEQDPTTLSILVEDFKKYDHANVQVALEEYLSQDGRSHELLGFTNSSGGLYAPNLQEFLSEGNAAGLFSRASAPKEGPVQYINVHMNGDRMLACVQSGLYLIRDSEKPFVVLLSGGRKLMQNP